MSTKKVLILAYEFPPYVSVAGLRPKSWFNYCKEFGFEPIVITRQWSTRYGNTLDYIAPGYNDKNELEATKRGIIIKAPSFSTYSNRLLLKYGSSKFKLLRKSLTGLIEILQFIIPIGPKKSIYNAAYEYLSSHKVDLIIATGDPFILFKYADLLGKKHSIPWIADYRDPWSNDMSLSNNKILAKYYQYFERKLLKSANQSITVSEFIKQKITEINPSAKVSVLPNGFDSDAIEKTKNEEQGKKSLTIAHAGSIFEWHPYEHFLNTFEELIVSHKIDIQLNFYGLNIEQKIKKLIQDKFENLSNHVHFFPKIPNQDLLIELKKSNLMLLFNYYSFMGTKIYDYIGIQRKILLCFSNDSVANNVKKKHFTIEEPKNLSNQLQSDLIIKTQAGIVVKDAQDLKVQLVALHKEFISDGKINCKSIGIENYSRKIQVKKLCEDIFLPLSQK